MNISRIAGVGLCLLGVMGGCRRATVADSRQETVIGPEVAHGTLYERIGGVDAIADLVSAATDRALADPAVNFRRTGTTREWHAAPGTLDRFRERLTDYLVSMTGGPVPYHGPTMLEVHHGMRITDREYDAFIADFRDALGTRPIDPTDGRELLRILEGLRGDIVEVR